MEEIGTLSLVATPIGNLEDITLRAIRTLKECDYVLCEDTRVTGKLLKHYEISAKLRRYDAHASEKVHEQVIGDLLAGKRVALVSDAGTPGISDPGVLLIQKIRTYGHPMSISGESGRGEDRGREEREILIEVIPGASAVTAAVSLAGIKGNQFVFLGFIPHKKGRETFFKSLATFDQPVVFFESTHRILKTLESLKEHYPETKLYIGRELTKMHEEMLIGTPAEISDILNETPVKQKGEFVVIFDNRK